MPAITMFLKSAVSHDGIPFDVKRFTPNADTRAALAAEGLTVDAVLQDNDAYHAQKKVGGLIVTGPTGTNVNDVAAALIR